MKKLSLFFLIGMILFAYGVAGSEEGDNLGKMIYIPAGEFFMGTDDPKLQGYFDIYGFRAKFQKKIKPAGKVHLEGFYIDTHEVTNGQYKKFVDDTKYNPPAHWEKGVYPAGQENYPVINVSWYDAEAYASWAGKRLPTEEEWEKAARGRGQRVFLWGDRSDGGIAELWKAAWGETEGPLQVGKFSFDRSPYGVMDMAGSVMEWTSGIYEYDESRVRTVRGRRVSKETNIGTEIVIKGGAWSSEILDTHISRKIFSPPDQISNGVGFRCAK